MEKSDRDGHSLPVSNIAGAFGDCANLSFFRASAISQRRHAPCFTRAQREEEHMMIDLRDPRVEEIEELTFMLAEYAARRDELNARAREIAHRIEEILRQLGEGESGMIDSRTLSTAHNYQHTPQT